MFARNAWYFRNALIRANYTDLQNNIHETYEYLELFLRNLLLDEKNELHNRYLHIKYKKVDIENRKVDIESIYPQIKDDFSTKTSNHIRILFMRFGFDEIFGRNMVMELLNLKSSGASKFISALLQANIIEPVLGQGKGKYKFKLKR